MGLLSLLRTDNCKIDLRISPPMPRPAGSPPQLKWHNTLPQHFAGFHSATQGLAPSRGSHKRQISSPDGIEAAFNAAVHASEKQATLTAPRNSRVLASPTKRQRSTQDLSSNTVTTPVKIQPNSGGIRSAGSGMQTPPPSSMGKRRGRPPKGASTNGHEVVMGRSPISSPTKQVGRSQTTQSASQSIPPITLNFHQDISTSHNMQENYSQLGLSVKSSTELTQDFGYCDASSPLGWAELPSGVGFDSDLPDIFGGADIYHGFPLLDQSDPTAFSFQDNESDCYPYVDPNMLFSSRATSAASSQIDAYGDDADDGLSPVIEKPYQHQYNYRKRERELELKRLQKKERAAKQMNESANLRVPPYNGFDSFSLKHSASESVLTSRREANFKAATLDAAVTRQLARSKSRDRMTPPGSRGGLDSLAVPKMPKIKTSVQFSISPSGRAKTETKVIYGSDTEPDVVNTELETFKVLDESLESDSSFDEAEPRGLAPGGKFYSNTKKPKKNAENVTPRSKPRLGKFQMTPMTEYARSFDWGDSDEEPPTPTKASGKKPYRQISAEFQSTTPRRRNPFDQQLLSSPRLLTPITSSPAKYNRRHTGVSVSLADLKMSSARKLKSMREESDESEAETVVDDPGSAMNFPIASLDNGSDGDALEALKNVVAKRRTSHQGIHYSQFPS